MSSTSPQWRISADEAGDPDAPLVVVIHGTMDRSTGMLRLSRRLDREFRVVRYDRRGYGSSIAPNGDFGTDAFVMRHQVADLVETLAGRRALLIGHSYGGNVALSTAMHHPDLVAGVAVYEAPMSWEPWWPGTTAGAAARATEGTAADAAERFMRRLIGDTAWESLPDKTRAVRRSEGPAMVGELRDLHANRPWLADKVSCPVVLGVGSRGAEHHLDGMRRMNEMIPQSTLVELAGCRHDAPNSHSELFAEAIVRPLAIAAGPPWSDAVACRPCATS